MTREEVVLQFLKEKILLKENGKIVLALNYYPKNSKIDQDFEKLLQDYADTFPKGEKTGGRLIRRSPNSIRRKMLAFTKARPDISYGVIIEAAEHYIKEAKQRDFQFCISSDYLISKNNSSELEALCDLILEGELKSSNDTFVTSLN